MTNDLIIRTDKGDFDLFGNEDIVETSSIFDLSNISSRSSDYSNEFNLPKTKNNIEIIGHADLITAINTLPYKRTKCVIVLGGIPYKNGFIEITTVYDTIKAKFFLGNVNFYDIIKSQNINEYDWSTYNHTWGVTAAVASASNTSGFIYPLINYGAQTTSLYLNIRKVLPCTFNKTISDKIINSNGYTANYDFDTSDFDTAIIPFASKNPQYPSDYLLLNSVDASNTSNYSRIQIIPIVYDTLALNIDKDINFTDLADVGSTNQYNVFTSGTSIYWNTSQNIFTANAPGVYSYSLFVEFVNYADYHFDGVSPDIHPGHGLPPTGGPRMLGFANIAKIIKVSGSSETAIDSASAGSTHVGGFTISGSIYLNQGDILKSTYQQGGVVSFAYTGIVTPEQYDSFDLVLTPQIKSTSTLNIALQNNFVFNGLLVYNQAIPKLKASDFFRDQCIRFGLIISVDEDLKIVSLRKFDDVTANSNNADDWSNKIDETQELTIEYKYDTYAQNNAFLHKQDKSIINTPLNSDYNLVINNANLDLQKTLYISPFAATEQDNLIAGANISAYINLYDTTSSTFNKDVEPRILFLRRLASSAHYTDQDGTGGSPVSVSNVPVSYFIDQTQPYSMGFGSNLMTRNSQTLINILQNLRIIKPNINLNYIDVKNIDFFKPVYIKQLDSLFFKSSINQFNYTNPQVTEVELIKLN